MKVEMYQYPRHRFTKEKLCSMKRQTFRLFCCILLVVVIVVLAIVLAAVLSRQSNFSEDSTDVVTSTPICTEFVQHELVGTSRASHLRCGHRVTLADECKVTEQDSWISFVKGSAAWNQTVTLLPDDVRNISSLIGSPQMTVANDSCSLQISFDLQSDSPVQVYLNSLIGLIPVNVTSDRCHYGIITDQSVLKELRTFHLIITSTDELTNDVTYGSVTSHVCVEFEPFHFAPRPTLNPSFVTVPIGEQNLCSLEIQNGDIDCDWFNVVGLSNARFAWTNLHPCLRNGVQYPNRPRAVNFLSLSTDMSQSTDFIMSPIVEGGSSYARLSFWYLVQCSGAIIRLYTIPTQHDANGIATGDFSPVHEIRFMDISHRWTYQVLEIPIPASYSSFHVVVEATISGEGNCSGYICNAGGPRPTRATESLLALDEITVEARYEQCNITNSSNVDSIDCAFQNDSDGSNATFCRWRSSFPSFIPATDPDRFLFLHWDLDSNGNADTADHGAQDVHLQGRGHVITFTNTLGTTENYFETSTLVANNACSCQMNFMYLLRGIFAPRLVVNLVLLLRDELPRFIPQWSVFGHQSDEWLEATVLLNLPTSVPFRIEFTARDLDDAKAEINLDNITFKNCDFRLYSQANANAR